MRPSAIFDVGGCLFSSRRLTLPVANMFRKQSINPYLAGTEFFGKRFDQQPEAGPKTVGDRKIDCSLFGGNSKHKRNCTAVRHGGRKLADQADSAKEHTLEGVAPRRLRGDRLAGPIALASRREAGQEVQRRGIVPLNKGELVRLFSQLFPDAEEFLFCPAAHQYVGSFRDKTLCGRQSQTVCAASNDEILVCKF